MMLALTTGINGQDGWYLTALFPADGLAPSKVMRKLGWEPRVTFQEQVAMMVDHDVELDRQERTLRDAGDALPISGALEL
jgi:GDP-D-mannose dehydratase